MLRKIAVTVLVILLIINMLIIGRALDIFRLPGEVRDVDIARRGAYTLLASYKETAEDVGLGYNELITNSLSEFASVIDNAVTAQEIATAIGMYGRTLQDTILEEQTNKWKEVLLEIINDDPKVSDTHEATLIVLKIEREGFSTRVNIEDEKGILTSNTKERIEQHELISHLSQIIEIEVSEGKAELLTPSSVVDKISHLESELDVLYSNLMEIQRLAGLSELTGQGVIIHAHDASGGYTWEEIVHDKDIRDIINLLSYAGASGVEVGGQRIVLTTSVRCAGPIILINQHRISVNPVIIKAIGNPNDLKAVLEPIAARFELFGKRLDITVKDDITLNAYKK